MGSASRPPSARAIGCPEKTVVRGRRRVVPDEQPGNGHGRHPPRTVKVLIMDNRCLGMVHQWQKLFYDKRYSSTLLDASPIS